MRALIHAAILAVIIWPAPADAGITGRFGMDAGAAEIGDRGLRWLGVGVGLERRFGGVAVGLEGGYGSMIDDTYPDPWRGRMLRGSALVRVLLAEKIVDRTLSMDAWLDVGVGGERIEWQRGGVLYRDELLVGFSGALGPDFGGGRWGDHLGVHMVLGNGNVGLQITTAIFFTD